MKAQIEDLVKKLNGNIIYLDEEAKIVLWQKGSEFIVHNIYSTEDKFFLENGNYANDIEEGMLKFLTKKNLSLNIKISLSEEDINDLRSGEAFNWRYNDLKSDIPINVSLSCNDNENM